MGCIRLFITVGYADGPDLKTWLGPWSIVLESVTCHLAVLLSPVDGILLKVLIEEKICA